MSCFDDDNIYTLNTIGLDYFDIINNLIKNILYPKPIYDNNLIRKLKLNKGTKLFYIINKKLNIKINVCEIIPETKYNKIIIFSHGNGCDIYTFYDYLKLLADNLKVCVVMYDYPEYGLSQGKLDEFTCYQCLEDVVSHYLNYTQKILLIGQSLGTGIVINFISKNQWINPVILISPYKSIPKIITDYDWIEYMVCKNKFASYLKISNTKCPIKIFHGKTDKLIAYTHSSELYDLMPNKKFKPTFYNNTGHNDILNKISFDEYRQILEFL